MARSLRSVRTWLVALAFLAGAWAIVWANLYAFGGREHLFQYSAHPVHKLTARAMMHGSLNLRRTVFGLGHDEQVYNGAGFTNWGFGVPLLQIPFHAAVPLLRRWIKASFFPDRLIFFIYLTALVPLLWAGVHRMIFPGTRPVARWVLAWVTSWAITLFVLACSLYDLLSFRFIVYEETIAYAVVAELAALASYSLFLDTRRRRWAAATGLFASIGLLVRATGLPYLAMWGVLIGLEGGRVPALRGEAAWGTGRERILRALRQGATSLGIFAAAALPGVAFLLVSNSIRSGSPFSFGYQNSSPAFPVHFAMLRFGSQCVTTLSRFGSACRLLFDALFLAVPIHLAPLTDCGFSFETRGQTDEPFLSPFAVLLVGVSFAWCLLRRERRLACYVPIGVFVALFLEYAHVGTGFVWRYGADFWPVVVLIGLQELRRLRVERPELLQGLAIAAVFCTVVHTLDDVEPSLHSLEVVDTAGMLAIEAEYARDEATPPPVFSPHINCGEVLPSWARGDGVGWIPGCTVGTITNVYLGVTPSPSHKYRVRFEVDRPLDPELELYVNGRYYKAHDVGHAYEATVDIDAKRLHSMVVLVAIEWTRAFLPPPIHLKSADLAPVG